MGLIKLGGATFIQRGLGAARSQNQLTCSELEARDKSRERLRGKASQSQHGQDPTLEALSWQRVP